MRHPKNPFSSDEPADDAAFEWRGDHELAADAAPGGGRGTPPPLPRCGGDSGFRPRGCQGPAPQDFWPQTDPEDSWPLAPRPQAEPAGSWFPAGRDDFWAAPPPARADPREDWAPAGPQEDWAQGDPREGWPPQGVPQVDWAQGDPREGWPPQGALQEDWAQGDPEDDGAPQGDPRGGWPPQGALQEDWAQGDPEDDGAPQGDPRGDWPQGGPEEPWAAQGELGGDFAQGGPEETWVDSGPAQGEAPDARGRFTDRSRDDRGPEDDVSRDDRQGWEEDPPRQERVPAAAAGQTPDEGADSAGSAPASMGFQDLWESWEPSHDPIGVISEPVRRPTAPYPELVRDTEYEDDVGLSESPAGGPGFGSGFGPGSGGGEPYDPAPRRRAQHARSAGRPRMSGAFLALAGALAIAGAIPLGILGARTLAHHGSTTLRTDPLSASRAAASAPGPNGAATFTAIAGPGCPAATDAAVFPYHAPNGDGWHPGTAAGRGPCGSSFSYSYLAMVPGNPGEWHDHYAWAFRTGMNNPSCTFSFYIPAAPQANSTDYYWFSAGDSNADNRIADFTIDQATRQGQWVTKGPFTFPGGTVLIEATDRGGGAPTASVAVGPVRLSC